MLKSEEACRIVVLLRGPGVVDVAAPMKHKDLCYDILRDARTVIERISNSAFSGVSGARIVISMSMAGVVDVAAPLPNRELCYQMLKDAKGVIERYDDAAEIPNRPFAAAMTGD